MQQKIIQIGNSTGIIIPKSVLDQIGLETGTEVELQKDITNKSLTIVKAGTHDTSSITNHFLKILEKVNTQYGSALKELAEK